VGRCRGACRWLDGTFDLTLEPRRPARFWWVPRLRQRSRWPVLVLAAAPGRKAPAAVACLLAVRIPAVAEAPGAAGGCGRGGADFGVPGPDDPGSIPCCGWGNTSLTPWRPPAALGAPAGSPARPRPARAGLGSPASASTAYPHEIHGGMRQRPVDRPGHGPEPPLVIADETHPPGLDVAVSAQVMAELTDLCREKPAAPWLLDQARPGDGRPLVRAESPCSIQGRLASRPPRSACSPEPAAPLDTPAGAAPGLAVRAVALLKRAPSAVCLSSIGLRCWHPLGPHGPGSVAAKAVDGVSLRLHEGEKPSGLWGLPAVARAPSAGPWPAWCRLRGGAGGCTARTCAPLRGREAQAGPAPDFQMTCFQDPLACLQPRHGRGRKRFG